MRARRMETGYLSPLLVKQALDLVLGRPRVALASTRLLPGEVTTPYGNAPTEDVVDAAWRAEAGDRACPPWMILGRRDAPSGTIWRIAWCPDAARVPPDAEISLPEGAWALELLGALDGPSDWHLRFLDSPSGTWASLWEGARCELLVPPRRDSSAAIERGRAIAAKRGCADCPELQATWQAPTPSRLSSLADSSPESELFELPESVKRQERRATAAAIARTGLALAALALATGILGAWQAWHARLRTQEESRLASVKHLVDHAASLAEARKHGLDSLRTYEDALRPSDRAAGVVAAIGAAVPPESRLQVLAIEATKSGWRARTEARLPDWNGIQPLAQALRTSPLVEKVSVANQSRQSDAVAAILELEGRWP